MKNKIKNIIFFVLILLCSITIVGSRYYYTQFPKQDFDVVLFTMFAGVENTSPDVVNGIISYCAPQVIFLLVLLLIPIIKKVKNSICLDIKFRKKAFTIQLFPIKLTSNHRIIYTTILLIISAVVFVKYFYVDEYIKNRRQDTKIFEDYYVDARDIKIEFPDKKRNLILILGESFENTVFSKENGGAWDYSLMPELEKLALENTSFSNNEKIGGARQVYGTTYSAAGNVAITSGAPLKTREILTDANKYTGNGSYLSGVYSIGEVLKDAGYNLEIIMGSDANFGGRKQYYETNGNYKIFDLEYAIDQGKMTREDEVWWGFDDDDLFDWSKEEIEDLAKKDEPFNFIMLTADTHFTDGYLSEKAEIKYDSQYENVHAYSSKCVNDFVNWVKKQDFYENTTIVIIGDHLGMQNDFYKDKTSDGYIRTVYNVIINPTIDAQNYKNRQFTVMDLYPTMLASLGATIEGDRIGLGTNLYSNTPTLVEELGFDYFNNEIKKNSKYYNKYILGNDYYIIKKQTEKEKAENE